MNSTAGASLRSKPELKFRLACKDQNSTKGSGKLCLAVFLYELPNAQLKFQDTSTLILLYRFMGAALSLQREPSGGLSLALTIGHGKGSFG